MSPQTRSVTRSIDALGATSLLAIAVATLLSLFLAATQPPLQQQAPHTAWFKALERPLAFLPAFLTDALHHAGPLATGRGFLIGYGLPLLISTACCVVLLVALARRQHELRDHDADRVLRWAIAFTVAAAPAFNVLTQDIWLSVAWGRMLNHGGNPFAEAFPLAFAADIPLEYDPMPMTYGPVWALVCSFAVAISFGMPLIAWFVLKLVYAGAWLLILHSVSELARPSGAWRRAFAVGVCGWLPIGVHCDVAEGHNDVVMLAFALLWARALARSSPLGPLALAASILTKYVTAPLVLVDLVQHVRARDRSVIVGYVRYVRRVLPACVSLLAGGLLVVLSARGINDTSSMRDWKFLDPADLFRLLARYSGWHIDTLGVPLVALALGATVLFELRALLRTGDAQTVRRAQLAIMALVLFAVVGHVWPWYFVWCVPFAALVPEFWLGRFVLAAAAIAPFTIIHWWRFDLQGVARVELPSLVMYAVAIGVAAAYAKLRANRRVAQCSP